MGTKPAIGTSRVAVSDELVSGLVRAQFPHFADRELGRVYHHSDQVAARLGDDLGVILPTTTLRADHLSAVAPWLESCSPLWRFPASVPVAMGSPTEEYPYPWAIVEWLDASAASVTHLNPSVARELMRALRRVHKAAPASAPASLTTARPLKDHQEEWESLIEAARSALGPEGERIDVDAFREVWANAVDAPLEPPVWTHGAISPLTVLADRGEFAGICDWLHFGAGDAAVDVAAASLLLPAPTAPEGRAGYGDVSPAFRARTFGWRHLLMLRWILSDNPFFWRYGWGRVADFPQLAAVGVTQLGAPRRRRHLGRR